MHRFIAREAEDMALGIPKSAGRLRSNLTTVNPYTGLRLGYGRFDLVVVVVSLVSIVLVVISLVAIVIMAIVFVTIVLVAIVLVAIVLMVIVLVVIVLVVLGVVLFLAIVLLTIVLLAIVVLAIVLLAIVILAIVLLVVAALLSVDPVVGHLVVVDSELSIDINESDRVRNAGRAGLRRVLLYRQSLAGQFLTPSHESVGRDTHVSVVVAADNNTVTVD